MIARNIFGNFGYVRQFWIKVSRLGINYLDKLFLDMHFAVACLLLDLRIKDLLDPTVVHKAFKKKLLEVFQRGVVTDLVKFTGFIAARDMIYEIAPRSLVGRERFIRLEQFYASEIKKDHSITDKPIPCKHKADDLDGLDGRPHPSKDSEEQ
jgi:hypothetical protein